MGYYLKTMYPESKPTEDTLKTSQKAAVDYNKECK